MRRQPDDSEKYFTSIFRVENLAKQETSRSRRQDEPASYSEMLCPPELHGVSTQEAILVLDSVFSK
jgi:hypothetical protein